MEDRKEKIIKIVYAAIDEVNTNLEKNSKINKSLDEILVGSSGKLDSLGIVNLIVAVEQKVEDEFGESISLANENAMSALDSPFKTVHLLVNYIEGLLKGNNE